MKGPQLTTCEDMCASKNMLNSSHLNSLAEKSHKMFTRFIAKNVVSFEACLEAEASVFTPALLSTCTSSFGSPPGALRARAPNARLCLQASYF